GGRRELGRPRRCPRPRGRRWCSCSHDPLVPARSRGGRLVRRSRPLVLSYYFPPIGGAGAQRPAKFVRYLHELGYDPAVVTGSGESVGRWTPRDETLVAEIPTDVIVRRASAEPVESTR